MEHPDFGVYDAAPEQYDAFQMQFFEHGPPSVGMAYQGMFAGLGLTAGQRILEVGVGTGLNLKNYPAGTTVVGIDRSEPMLNIARGRLEGLTAKVELVQADGAKLPFEDGEFDAVVCTFVLCSCADPSGMLSEMTRVCRRGGRMALFDFHKARTNQALLGDQMLLHETLKRGIISQGRPVAVCDSFYELERHLPEGKVKITFDEHLEGSIATAFRATVVEIV